MFPSSFTAAVLILALGAVPSAAQRGDERLYHADHGRWAVDCTQDALWETIRCFLTGGAERRDGNERRYIVVTIGPWSRDRAEVAVYPDPPGSAAETVLRIDAHPPHAFRCDRECILRDTPAARAIAQEMRSGKVMRIRLTDRRSGERTDTAMDLAGFDGAWRDWHRTSARLHARSSL